MNTNWWIEKRGPLNQRGSGGGGTPNAFNGKVMDGAYTGSGTKLLGSKSGSEQHYENNGSGELMVSPYFHGKGGEYFMLRSQVTTHKSCTFMTIGFAILVQSVLILLHHNHQSF